MPFVRRLAHVGMLNSLSRLVLKCTIPGVPDTYQGTEFWDFSLVDPDNRRPVDFDGRIAALGGASPVELLESWMDGRVKQEVVRRLLADRAEAPELYAFGDYLALSASGEGSRHMVAFSRNWQGASRVIVAGRLLAELGQGGDSPLAKTFLPVPIGRWRDVLTEKEWDFDSGSNRSRRVAFAIARRCPTADRRCSSSWRNGGHLLSSAVMTGFAPVIHVGVAPESLRWPETGPRGWPGQAKTLATRRRGEKRIPLRKRTELER